MLVAAAPRAYVMLQTAGRLCDGHCLIVPQSLAVSTIQSDEVDTPRPSPRTNRTGRGAGPHAEEVDGDSGEPDHHDLPQRAARERGA